MAVGKVIKSEGGEQVVARTRGVVNAEEYDAREQARAIREQAKRDADAIIDAAHQERERIVEEARAAGREEGLVQVSSELARAKMQASDILKQARQDIISLSLKVAEKILGRDLERDPSLLVDLCATAIENVRNARQLVLRVNPSDSEMLRTQRKLLIDMVARSVDIAIKDDPEVEPYGCIVQTEFGTIDAQLTTQLQMIGQVLLSDESKKGKA